MGKKDKQRAPRSPAATVKKLIKAGKVKGRCCRSSSRCKKCPVLALRKAKSKFAAAA
ncbi:hypothetical protein [Microlunatus speluncae]|uniref:hypothetical protein n=1 Tax=Microlunatus speluncae TaxID=2594267 RepID=UPI001478F041|nr:hypothetical protein [Microlunatus speluncae]